MDVPRYSIFPTIKLWLTFFAQACQNEFELKSKSGAIGKKIADGAYEKFIERITSNNNPDFFILSYSTEELCVNDLWIIPKYFFIPEIVEKRKPLADTAKRTGWIGCNILFDQIPVQGQIELIKNRIPIAKDTVISNMRRASLLQTSNLEARGWLLDVLSCLNSIHDDRFLLEDVYRFEDSFLIEAAKRYDIKGKSVYRNSAEVLFYRFGASERSAKLPPI